MSSPNRPRTNPGDPGAAQAASRVRTAQGRLAAVVRTDRHGRGARSNLESRFEALRHEADADAAEADTFDADGTDCLPATVPTVVADERCVSIISRNQSPDIGFDRSLNPYRGCEHGCIYCYARPSHAWLGLSPGLDFETRLFAKTNAAEVLERQLRQPGYRPAWIALGANTDPYQPLERERRITRALLEVLLAFRHPVGITTKSALITRDLDLLVPMAAAGLVQVNFSIGTLDRGLARTMEPRAPTPARRLRAMRELAAAGVPVSVIVAPIIPALNDAELESVLAEARAAGARSAAYVNLRLPLEVRDLFVEWLQAHHPLRAAHVMSLVQQQRDGADNDPRFGVRMTGTGTLAALLRQRFALAARRLGYESQAPALDASQFRVPADPAAPQLALGF